MSQNMRQISPEKLLFIIGKQQVQIELMMEEIEILEMENAKKENSKNETKID